ncbi:MAG: Hpt domain-containing protein [Tsuneonella sp.]
MAEFEAQMAALRKRFAARAVADSGAIRRCLAKGERDALRDLCHGLAGTAGTFGYPAISEAALALEEAVEAGAGAEALETLSVTLLQELDALP